MKFKQLPKLTGAISTRLNASLGGDGVLLAEDIEEKKAQLWECDGGDAYMITRIDRHDLVICCYEGKNVKHMMPHMIDAARKEGLKTVRFHTKRPALARLLKDYKPELSEYVFKIPVDNVPE